jgi:predicted phosphodiesterase
VETFVKTIQMKSESEEYEIWGIGDIHAGARACDENAVKAAVKRIKKNPNALWIGMGDYTDSIVAQDTKRFDPTGLAPWISIEQLWDAPQLQREWVQDTLAPIADRCIGLLEGNHEDEMMKRYNQNITAAIASAFNAPYLCYSTWGYLKFVYKSPTGKSKKVRRLSLYAHHGYGGGRYVGAKTKKLSELGLRFHADITMQGHHHDPVLRPTGKPILEDRYGGKKPTFKVRSRIECTCPSFYKTLIEGTTTYPEKQGYDFTWIGGTYGTVRPFVREGEGPDDRGYKLGLHAIDL